MNNTTAIKEPFMRIRRRGTTSFLYRSTVRIVAILISFIIGLIFLSAVSKKGVGDIIRMLFEGVSLTQKSKLNFWKDAMLLLLISIALTPAFKMKFWNIGGQGQVLMGGLLTSVIMYYGTSMSNGAMIFVSFIVSILAGALWAAIPAIFKVKLNANETLFTLMMNDIAVKLAAADIDTWNGQNSELPPFNTDTRLGYLPSLGSNVYGILIMCTILLTILISIYMKHTKHGYEISVVGESLRTAKYAGMNTSKVIIRTVALSGALCGLAGFFYVAGVDHVLSTTTSGSYGFTAIIVSWAAAFNPYGMFIISLIITFLSKGTSNVVNFSSNLNSYTAYITVGILLFFLIGCEFFIQYKIVYNQKTQAKLDAFNEKVHKAMPWWFDFWKKVSDGIEKCIATVQKWISEKLALLKAALIKIVKKNAPEQPQEQVVEEVKKDEKEVGIHD